MQCVMGKRTLYFIFLTLVMISNPSGRIFANQEDQTKDISIEALKVPYSEGREKERLSQHTHEVDLADPYLVLVNAQHPWDKDHEVDLVEIQSGHLVERQVQKAYQQLYLAAQRAGHELRVVSAYRTIDQQMANRQRRINGYTSMGYSHSQAVEWTNSYYAQPNTTEHLTGLALDILGNDWLAVRHDLSQEYWDYPSAKWLAKFAHRYGFILRYPQGKEDQTGYHFEPWHYRYVGRVPAIFIHEHNLTLEEYLDLLEAKKRQDEDSQPLPTR